MNPTEKEELMHLIQFIKDKFQISVLLVEHDMKVVMGICQRIAVLEYGVKIAEGTPAEIQSNPKVIAAYLGTEDGKARSMLEVNQLEVSYGTIKALHGVSLKVPEKSIVTLIGANGAGKSTTLRAISGLIRAGGGQVKYDGKEITNQSPHAVVSKGLCHVPEGRMVFANLTVEENLRMGAYLRRDKAGIKEDVDYAFTMFPRLKERISQLAGTLSGGEQQMLAIARAS
nr:ATP-binding cassette domain-containing protein [Verrucomicrobium spinosum]